MFEVTKNNKVSILHKIRKDKHIEVCRIITTPENRLLITKTYNLDRYKFKGDKPVKFKRLGTESVAVVSGTVRVFTKPHHATFHREVMRQNGLALYRGLPGTDTDRLLNNMLEFIARV